MQAVPVLAMSHLVSQLLAPAHLLLSLAPQVGVCPLLLLQLVQALLCQLLSSLESLLQGGHLLGMVHHGAVQLPLQPHSAVW